MHTRHDRAAVDLTEAPQARRPAEQHSANPSTTLSLWAERPLGIADGRLIAVRLRGDQVQVRLVDSRDGLSRWRPAEGLISEFQAAQWVANSRFHT